MTSLMYHEFLWAVEESSERTEGKLKKWNLFSQEKWELSDSLKISCMKIFTKDMNKFHKYSKIVQEKWTQMKIQFQ